MDVSMQLCPFSETHNSLLLVVPKFVK